ncbi:hypothetical protein AMECASPLE_026611 [Ameca splendens]|uniref:Uncharacterized protein n=1 Tax=Ameca splendens TaxID=208324 RepID=A0ABV0YSQ3_9TELE
MLHTAWRRPPRQSPMPPQPKDRAPKPGTEIQGNPNDPEEPAPAPDNPQDPNLNPIPDPDQKARSFSRPPIPDGKQQTRVGKDPKPTSARSNVVLIRVVVVCI